jgi:alkylation response protein AidB-like acyl-CoA dehydrogenase
MNADHDRDDLRFRDEVRTFLDEKLTPDLRRAGRLMTSVYADRDTMRAWQSILYAQGWVAPAWPEEYGGCGWSPVRRYIFATELAMADAPALSPMGLSMCGPVLIGHGSIEQKAFYLPRILSGEDFWCQGYSEPQAGSDLASLQMRAEDIGHHFICNGQKIWTTHGMLANRIFCLVRSSSEGAQQRGITFLLIDMNTPGIEVKPITMLSGEQIQCEIFFRDVKVPKENVVGRIGDGWTVAKYLLQFERGGNAAAPGLKARLRRVRDLAKRCGVSGDEGLGRKIAQTDIEISALEFTEHRLMADRSGAPSGIHASMLKIRATELSQRITEVALEVAALDAVPFQPEETFPGGWVGDTRNTGPIGPDGVAPVAPRYLNERAGSIYAGSNEIQRNIISKAGLNL